MRLAVVGAGVVGVTTAYALLQDGHDVTVFEKCSTAAEGASFANAGLLAPEWMGALAHEAFLASQSTGRPVWSGFLRRSPPAPSMPDPGPAVCALSKAGAEALSGLCDRLQITPDSHQGMMVVWKEPKHGTQAERLLAQVRRFGGEAHLMSATQARELEIALSADTTLHGALVMPGTWSVNCRQFTLLLKAQAQQQGCRFEFGATVTGLDVKQEVRLQLDDRGTVSPAFDSVVLCAGTATSTLLESVGTSLPMHNWTGHTLSASLRQPLDAPVAVVHDLPGRVSMARMGQRIRVSGPLARAGQVTAAAAFKHLYEVLDSWFPGTVPRDKTSGVQEWQSDVVSTPDALPLIGPTPVRGVWVNAAHGIHGWSMACGSAMVLADLLSGRNPALDVSPYLTTRWSGR